MKAVAIVLIAGALAGCGRESASETETAPVTARASTTSVARSTTTAPLPPPTNAPAPVVIVTTPEPRPGPTTTAPDCRNNRGDPACGAFSWQPPPPPNQDTTIEVSYVPEQPRVGEVVTFTVRLRDADGVVSTEPSPRRHVRYGDGAAEPEMLDGCASGWIESQFKYGPWDTPPAPLPTEAVGTFTHTYASAATYTAEFMFAGGCDTPWDWFAETTVPVVVAPG